MARKRSQGSDPVKQLTVVFDYGGVVAKGYDPVPHIQREVGGDLEVVRDAYWGNRAAYDRGEHSADEYWGLVASAAGFSEMTADEVQRLQEVDNRYWGEVAPQSRELLHDLARNEVRMVLLTNASSSFGEFVRKQDWFEAFSFAIVSAEEGVAKPSQEIFETLLDTVAHETGGVARPHNVIYFDDVLENVEAAQQLGIDAHLWPRNGSLDTSGQQYGGVVGPPEGEAEEASADELAQPGWELAREVLAARGVALG